MNTLNIGTEIDVDKARAETPGCANVIHFNNAGAALPPRKVIDTVNAHWRAEADVGGYEAAAIAEPKLAETRRSIATLINAGVDDISLTESATKAWQSIFYALDFRPGDRILTGHAEYASNVIAFLHMAKRTGATLEVIPDDETGQLDTDALRARMDERVRLVAMSHVPTQGGLVNPAEEVGEIVREWPAVYLLDACQSAGQLPLDVGRIRCDALSVTGRKYVRGPRGTGFLYTSAELRAGIEPAVLDLDSAIWTAPDEYRVHETGRMFESWERNLAATLGLGAAVDYALSWGIPAIARRVGALAQRLRDSLADIPGVAVHDQGRHKCGIVTFTVAGLSARAVTERLRAEQINTWVTPLGGTPSRFEGRGLPDLVRASLHYYNTEEEMAKLIAQVTLLARENR